MPEPLSLQYEGLTEYFNHIEAEFEKVNKVAGCLRSIAASVNLPPQIKPLGYILTKEVIITQQTDLLSTLGKCTKVSIIKDEK